MSNISTLVGLKNNLEYSKKFYTRFREVYPTEELCFASYGSDDGTNEWLDSLTDENLKYYYSKDKKTFSDTFNKCAEIATKEYIVFCHNDIVMLEGWLENIEKHLNKSTAVTYTTIEPPIFSDHERPGKIIRDFGLEFEDVNYEELEKFGKETQEKYKNQTTEGNAFFIAQHRGMYLAIGGMDNLYSPMFCEDDDILFRLKLLGIRTIVSLDSIVYHFVSKTSRFSEEHKTNTQEIERKSNLNKVRKWGRIGLTTDLHTYDIGLIIPNCNEDILRALEPFVSTIFVDCDFINYINSEQPNTKINLSRKIKPINSVRDNDIILRCNDVSKFTNDDFGLIANLSNFISNEQVKPNTTFDFQNFTFNVKSKNTYEHKLVSLKSDYYLDKCI
jgi:GT2 family glycosyltransferase